jgi:hypothetical protein
MEITNYSYEYEAFPVLNYLTRHEEVWGLGGIAPPFLILAIGGGE